MRVSAPLKPSKPSDNPAHKPYKARSSPASGVPYPASHASMQVNRPPDRPKHLLLGSLRPLGSNLRREHPDHQRVPGEFTGVPMHAGPVSNEGRPTLHACRNERIRCSRAAFDPKA